MVSGSAQLSTDFGEIYNLFEKDKFVEKLNEHSESHYEVFSCIKFETDSIDHILR